MMTENQKLASELLKIAKELYTGSDYIYDPEHKKHPSGGYHKTDKGWTKNDSNSDTSRSENKPKKSVKDMNYDEKGKLVRNYENTSPDVLDEVVDSSPYSDQWLLRVNVARHPNTSKDTLDKLSNDGDDRVRIEVLNNRNTSKSTVNKMKKDKNKSIQWAANRRSHYGEIGGFTL